MPTRYPQLPVHRTARRRACPHYCSSLTLFSPRAFSLVEVVLALGIVAFAVLTLFALFPIGLQSEKTSSSETAAVNLMRGIVDDLTVTPSTNSSSYRFGLTPLPGNTTTPAVSTNYMTDTATNASPGAAQFRVVMNYTPAVTNVPGRYAPAGVLVQIFWPASSPTNSAQGFYESYATFPPYTL